MQTPDNFLGLEPTWCGRQRSRYRILPIPYEATVSYGTGTAAGPAAIIAASQQVELYDGFGEPYMAGIHTEEPVDFAGAETAEAALARIEQRVLAILAEGKTPIGLGGEHTVSLGCVTALGRANSNFGVVQFDAHADLRDAYDETPWSHACVARRIHELGIPLFQIGVRSRCPEEIAYRRQHGIGHLDADRLAREDLLAPLLPQGFPPRIYLTFDVDGLDPSVIPATGTPEPGGLTWWQAMDALGNVCRGRQVLGADVVELAPVPVLPYADFAAAKLTYAIIGCIERAHSPGA